MRWNRMVGIAVLAALAGGGWAQSGAVTEGEGVNYSLSPVKAGTLGATRIMYQTVTMGVKETGDGKGISDFLANNVGRMLKELRAGGVDVRGGAIFIFREMPKAGSSVAMEIGFPVGEDVKAVEGYEVRVLGPELTASGVYRGPYEMLGKGIGEFFQQMRGKGEVPAGELRERSLFYDGEGSGNNVLLIEMPIGK